MNRKLQTLMFDGCLDSTPSLVELELNPGFQPAGNQPRIVSLFKGIGREPLVLSRTTHQDSGYMGARDWINARVAQAAA